MTGKEANTQKHITKINAILSENHDKEYLTSYYNWMKSDNVHLSLTTIINYLRHAVNFMNYYPGISLNELDKEKYVDYLGTIEGVASYRITVYSALKRYSEWLYDSGRCEKFYMNEIKRPKHIEDISTIQKREKGFLDEAEMNKYLNNIKDRTNRRCQLYERDMAIALVGLTTGLRISAIYQLDVDSIDYETGMLVVTEKTGKPRIALLPEQTMDAIQDWLKIRKPADEDEKALFLTNHGTRLTVNGITEIIQKYAKNIEGKHITPHKLRATYGSNLYEKTNDIYFVQKCMNHSSVSTTGIYIRGKNNEINKKAQEIMNDLIKV